MPDKQGKLGDPIMSICSVLDAAGQAYRIFLTQFSEECNLFRLKLQLLKFTG